MENNFSGETKNCAQINGENSVIEASEFKKKLKAVGWNQKRLCAALGFSETWLSKIIHGARDMDCNDLLRICKLTGLSPLDLLGYKPDEFVPAKSEDRVSEELFRLLPEAVIEKIIKLRQEKESR